LIVYTPRARSTSWAHTAATPAKTSPNTPSDAAYTVASALSTPAATRPPASAAEVSTNATVVTSTADTTGAPRPIRPANIMSRRPVSSSRRVIPEIRLIPISGNANEAMKPNSFAITPPRVAMPYTWPLMASKALPLPVAAAYLSILRCVSYSSLMDSVVTSIVAAKATIHTTIVFQPVRSWIDSVGTTPDTLTAAHPRRGTDAETGNPGWVAWQ